MEDQKNATDEVIEAAKALNEHPGAWANHGDAKMAELMMALRTALDGHAASQAAGS